MNAAEWDTPIGRERLDMAVESFGFAMGLTSCLVSGYLCADGEAIAIRIDKAFNTEPPGTVLTYTVMAARWKRCLEACLKEMEAIT